MAERDAGKGSMYSSLLVSNRQDSLGARDRLALWRSGTKVTSVAILLIRTAHRQQRTGTSFHILA